jgi:hypothetical protein
LEGQPAYLIQVTFKFSTLAFAEISLNCELADVAGSTTGHSFEVFHRGQQEFRFTPASQAASTESQKIQRSMHWSTQSTTN